MGNSHTHTHKEYKWMIKKSETVSTKLLVKDMPVK